MTSLPTIESPPPTADEARAHLLLKALYQAAGRIVTRQGDLRTTLRQLLQTCQLLLAELDATRPDNHIPTEADTMNFTGATS